MRHFLLLISLLFTTQFAFSQNGTIEGKIYDERTKEELPFANVILMKKGKPYAGITTDLDGSYSFANVAPGTYSVRAVYVGYPDEWVYKIKLHQDQNISVDVFMKEGTIIGGPVIARKSYIPMIKHDEVWTGMEMNAKEIARFAF